MEDDGGDEDDAAAFAAFDGFDAPGGDDGEEGEEGDEDEDGDDLFVEPTPEELDALLSKELDAELSGKKRKRKRPSEFDKDEDEEDNDDDDDDDANDDDVPAGDKPAEKPKRVRYCASFFLSFSLLLLDLDLTMVCDGCSEIPGCR